VSDSKKRAQAAIDAARVEIDRIDGEILRLLSERARQVRDIGDAKHRLGEPIYQPDREEKIFDRLIAANPGPLDDGAIRRLFERILDEARRLERSSYKDDEDGAR
jgi:chorismate mutase